MDDSIKEILLQIAQASDNQIDTEITDEIKDLVARDAMGPKEMKSILDRCAYASLASDFAMLAMDSVWKMLKGEDPKAKQEFEPNWVSAPGNTIVDLLEEDDITIKEFAELMEMDWDKATGLLCGTTEITSNIADQLASKIGMSSDFWKKRESQYREGLRRLTHLMSPDLYDVLDNACQLEKQDQTDKALDLLYGHLDDFMRAGRFDLINQLFEKIKPEDYTNLMILSLLSITFPAEPKVPARRQFYLQAKETIRKRGGDAEALLGGLEYWRK